MRRRRENASLCHALQGLLEASGTLNAGTAAYVLYRLEGASLAQGR